MKRLIVVSGAGLSVESGIRAFRTDTDSGKAMWDEYDIDEVCNLRAFNAGYKSIIDPNFKSFEGIGKDGQNLYYKTHEFYSKRRQELQTVEPNLGHVRIAEWYKNFPGQVVNVTTNVDDLLERAGVDKKDVYHLHGFLTEVRIKNSDGIEHIKDIGYKDFDLSEHPWAKPNVTFFGETAPWYMGQINIFDTLTENDLVILVGCSNQVINFNWELFPALNLGTKMIVINPIINYDEEKSYEQRGVEVFRMTSVEAFSSPKLIDLVESHLNS